MFRTALGLLLAGFLLGDGLGLLGLAWITFRDRQKGRIFWFLSWLFFSLTLFLLAWIAAGSELAAESRTRGYRIGLLVAFSVLALGVWPAVLHIIFGLWRRPNGLGSTALKSGEQPAEFWIERIAEIVRREQMSPEAMRAAVEDALARFFQDRK